jgi:two-component system response regulator PilR (NtrC family)
MKDKNILIVDDEPDIRELLEITLGRMGLETVSAENLESAHQALESHHFDLCLTDMKLPDGNGMTLIEHIQNHYPNLPVAMITAFGNVDIAINALKAGAFDFVSKPINLDNLRNIILSALNLESPQRNDSSQQDNQIHGDSQAMQSLRQTVAKVSRSQAPVHITGESGTGKELVAREIHNRGSRKDGPFIAVNCGAIPTELMESEFFGHKKGSFTGANQDKTGLFQAASGGSLFLDEVADLPLDMQVKLLRAIQEKAVRQIGSDKETPVDIRLLSATHKDLETEIQEGRFRQDLFFRVNVIQLAVPALRDRPEDIPTLCQVLLDKLNHQAGSQHQLDTTALQKLVGYSFPGNVRELENILERTMTLCDSSVIRAEDLQLPANPQATLNIPKPTADNELTEQQDVRSDTRQADATNSSDIDSSDIPEHAFQPAIDVPTFTNLEELVNSVEKQVINQALEANRWNKTAAAKQLGMTFRQLRYKLKKLKID